MNRGEFEITTFQEEHRDEYMVKEVNSGECRLFRKGVLELSWREESGQRVGEFTVYEKGRALRKESWKSFQSCEEHRYVENTVHGMKMVIRRGEQNRVVYRGDYDYEESMKRVVACWFTVCGRTTSCSRSFRSSRMRARWLSTR